ncbi:hypothetical protein ACJRO7_025834 [Eucalyptus globulus]|uniref:Uncharacterized protein n=1 Tax=Eucalyptus globulus TaxID=34317 RepID=A0ABD3KBE1_EUCGL
MWSRHPPPFLARTDRVCGSHARDDLGPTNDLEPRKDMGRKGMRMEDGGWRGPVRAGQVGGEDMMRRMIHQPKLLALMICVNEKLSYARFFLALPQQQQGGKQRADE